MSIDETFISKRINALRTQKNVSARDMSLSLGQSESYINKIENGRTLPSVSGLMYICDYFNISPADFFAEDNQNPLLSNELVKELKKLSPKQMQAIVDLIHSFQ